MNLLKEDIKRRLNNVKKAEKAIIKRSLDLDKKDKLLNNKVSLLHAREENTRAQRLTILSASEREVGAFEQFKKDKLVYYRLMKQCNKVNAVTVNQQAELNERLKEIRYLKEANIKIAKGFDKKEKALKSRISFITSKIAVIKNRERGLSKELQVESDKLNLRSEVLNKELTDFRKSKADQQSTVDNIKREIDLRVKKIDLQDLKLKQREALLIRKEEVLRSLSTVLNLRNKKLSVLAGKIDASKLDLIRTEDAVLKKQEEVVAELKKAEIKVKSASEIHAQAKKKLKGTNTIEATLKKNLSKARDKLKKVLKHEKSLTAWNKTLKRKEESYDVKRRKMAKDKRAVNKKLKFIRKWEKEHKGGN